MLWGRALIKSVISLWVSGYTEDFEISLLFSLRPALRPRLLPSLRDGKWTHHLTPSQTSQCLLHGVREFLVGEKKKGGSQPISNEDAVVSVTAESVCCRAHIAPGGLGRCFPRTLRIRFSVVVPCGGKWAVPRGADLGCRGCIAARKAPPIPAGSGT